MEHGFFVGFTRETDGEWRWVTISELAAEIEDTVLGGKSRDWDGAKIDAVEGLHEPSAEGDDDASQRR